MHGHTCSKSDEEYTLYSQGEYRCVHSHLYTHLLDACSIQLSCLINAFPTTVDFESKELSDVSDEVGSDELHLEGS